MCHPPRSALRLLGFTAECAGEAGGLIEEGVRGGNSQIVGVRTAETQEN